MQKCKNPFFYFSTDIFSHFLISPFLFSVPFSPPKNEVRSEYCFLNLCVPPKSSGFLSDNSTQTHLSQQREKQRNLLRLSSQLKMYRSYLLQQYQTIIFCIMYNVKSIRILVEIFIEKVKRIFAKCLYMWKLYLAEISAEN